METVECLWKDLFDDKQKESLATGFFTAGIISIASGFCINYAIYLTNVSLDSSYRNLGYFTLVACLRRIVPLFAYLPFFNYVGRSNSDYRSCELFAFLETFLAVFEVEWLTHVCIERYVVAKYATNGWPMQKYHYTIFQCLCLFFASMYSFPPFLGIGRYDLDFHCSFCTFDMILQDSWQRYVVVIIFILRSIKPAMVMLTMLIWARILERKLVCSKETQEQVKFTKNIIAVTMVNQICWFPIALIRGCVVLSQMMFTHTVVPASPFYIKWAMWMHWVAPAFSALTLFALDKKLREQIFQPYYIQAADISDHEKSKEE